MLDVTRYTRTCRQQQRKWKTTKSGKDKSKTHLQKELVNVNWE